MVHSVCTYHTVLHSTRKEQRKNNRYSNWRNQPSAFTGKLQIAPLAMYICIFYGKVTTAYVESTGCTIQCSSECSWTNDENRNYKLTCIIILFQ